MPDVLAPSADLRRLASLRRVAWGGAALALLLPAVAMLFTHEVDWGPGDFLAAAGLLGAACFAVELALRRASAPLYVAAFALAVLTAVALLWVQLAIGVVGEPGDPANVVFLAAPAVGVVGALAARLRARGMAWAMAATAAAQAVASLVAAGGTAAFWPAMLFAVPWLLSSAGFHRAHRHTDPVAP